MSNDAYSPSPDRYDRTPYRRVGRSGVQLPPISLGCWQNFGENRDPLTLRTIVRRAFDLGVNHLDLANNYGPPPGSAETHVGRILAQDFRQHRDELVISTKAGYRMWDGPFGDGGSRKYLLNSLDRSLERLGLDHVDIFYHHREDPQTPLEETMGALAHAVRSGKALYAGISNYSPEKTRQAARMLADLGTPLLIHQPSYSMFNRHIEHGLLDVVEEIGVGIAAFSPLQQGLLTNRYLSGVPQELPGPQDPPPRSTSGRSRTLTTSHGCAASRRSPTTAARASPSWPWPGRCATSRSARCWWGRRRSRSWSRTSPRSRTSRSPMRSSSASTSSRSTAQAR